MTGNLPRLHGSVALGACTVCHSDGANVLTVRQSNDMAASFVAMPDLIAGCSSAESVQNSGS